ncbi:YbfB/YjiJ family MFS transporter [Pollutimonas bauzanensis]|uniref:Predicted arabinose efflux permease, MFS family n=1 Tax=Pollutimonas bauzanensis TaxID=658167 RepID=A0A1M5NHP6_9BURK|nr:YbfB/YjiJ family MFS transporter [Pollutimonas bauzanensis]SHG89040.1 Predicted arabinose efflux permease, MFS family [Pollutimonas bauzanensis]
MKAALAPWALSGGAAVSVGFARFGYALILPAMKTDLHLNYAQAGWLNTANSLGYLLGAVLAIYFVARLGNRALFVWGIALTTLSLLANGMTHDFQWLTLFRFLAGLGAAGTFICGGVLSGVLGARAIVIFFSGGGIGMLLSGAALPWLFSLTGAAAWPVAWLAIGAICVPLAIAAALAARAIAEPSVPGTQASWPWRHCAAEFIAYFFFGLGYIAYMTFMIAWVNRHIGESAHLAAATSVMWIILGAMTLAAPLLWRRLFSGRRDGRPMGLALLVLALGAALPLLLPNLAGIWLSAMLVGGSVFMVPSAVTGFVKANLPAPAWGGALAVATSLFAIGQTIGPVACGWISDLTGSLSSGLAASAAVLFLAALLALQQESLRHKAAQPVAP